MPHPIILLPAPRHLEQFAGTLPLRAGGVIRLVTAAGVVPGELFFTATRLQEAVQSLSGHRWPIVATGFESEDGPGAKLVIDPASVHHPQGYQLAITADGIRIAAASAAGVFYGVQSLVQLLRQFPDALPQLRIEDEPDFPVRGVMLDISRDKVPTMETLYALVDQLAEWKINQLQLYTEHTFAYQNHREVWAQASPMTGEEILALDGYCRQRFVELVPNQNSFGHLARWLNLPRYEPLAEAPEGADTPWGTRIEGPFSLCPTEPRSLELLREMYDELLPHFSSRLFNVGCDETVDVGQGRSKAACAERGKERVYLEFLLKIHQLVRERGRTMQFWGDIILHRPELIAELPKDIIALEWGYEANHPFDRDGRLFHEAGIPFYVCPGTSTWLSVGGRTDNALANLRSAAENGLKHGAIGYLNTDWGDHGHWQPLPVSYLGFAAGAAYSWCLAANSELPVAAALDLHAFQDRAGVMGQLAYQLGNVYQMPGQLPDNQSILFRLLICPLSEDKWFGDIAPKHLDAAEAAIATAMAPLDRARMTRSDATLIADEFRQAAALLRHACRRARWRLDGMPANTSVRNALAADLRSIVGEHRRLWLARNRVGGLSDSAAKMEKLLDGYHAE